jgi:hypothetical protein
MTPRRDPYAWWGDIGHKIVFWALLACGIAAIFGGAFE